MKKNIPLLPTLIIAVILVAGAFYGGYLISHTSTNGNNLTAAQRAQRGQQFANRAGRGMGQGAGAGFVSGQIISKNDQSLTVQLNAPDATTGATASGSKIILLAPSSIITKATTGTIADLSVGEQITATGAANADGSITAKTIQLRPAGNSQRQ